MSRGLPLIERISRSAGAVIGVLAAMLLAGWASFGHQHAVDDSCDSVHGHDGAGHGNHAPGPNSDARHRDDSGGEHESDHCALCELQARIPNVVPMPVALPVVVGIVSVVILDAPETPSLRVPRPRLARGPPDSSPS